MSKKKFEKRDVVGKTFYREMDLTCKNLDIEKRTVELAFSSEEPYQRWWGVEVLSHKAGAVDLSRLNNDAPLLVNHDMDQLVGVVESARVDGEKTGRSHVRFGRSAYAEEIFRDVQDGIRKKVSVGYSYNEEPEQIDKGGDEYLIKNWSPHEISLASIAADDTVGVGRQFTEEREATTMSKENHKAPEEVQTTPTPTEERGEVQTEAKTLDNRAAAAILKLGRKFAKLDLAEKFIEDGKSLNEFNTAILESMDNTARDVPNERKPAGEIIIPRRRGRMKAFPNTRDGEKDAYRSGMWALATIFKDEDAMRWCKDYDVRVMTGTTSTTANVVPDELILPIIDLREEYGLARRLCHVHPMSSDTATVPRRKSGVTAYFVGRDEDTTESDAAFEDVNLVARELSALTRVSKSYVADSAINLGDHIAAEMGYAFVIKEDDAWINGDGTSTYGGIYGIRAKIVDGTHTEGAFDATSGTDTFAEIDAGDLLQVSGGLPDYPGINPVWLASKKANAWVFGALKAAAGGNTGADLSQRVPPSWDGDPIEISQSMPKVATALNNVAMLIYGDFNMGCTFGDRAGFEVDVLVERYAEKRQIGIIATERMDINVHGLGDTSNAGPIVALIGNT